MRQAYHQHQVASTDSGLPVLSSLPRALAAYHVFYFL